MYVMDAKEKNTPFILDPGQLKLNNQFLINESVLALLSQKNINFFIDVYDSAPNTTNKPVILFIHGNSTSKKVFAPQIKHYQNDYRIIAIDLIGHGKSVKICELTNLNEREKNLLAESLYNFCVMTAAVKAVILDKKLTAIHIFGWSLGGHIAYGIAMENPELVASITTVGSPPIVFSTAGLKKGLSSWFVETLISEWINNPKFYSLGEAEKIILAMGFTEEDRHVTADFATTDPQMRKCLFKRINDYEKNYAAILNGEQFVKSTPIPLCLIFGEKDKGINNQYIKQFGQFNNVHSQLAIIKDAPHAVFRTHPTEFYKITDRFIAGCVN